MEPNNSHVDDHQKKPEKKTTITIKYKECLKNHAASLGGNATDGCGEFMPSGEDGTLESLKCSACNCHRNFHRKHNIDSDYSNSNNPYSPHHQHYILSVIPKPNILSQFSPNNKSGSISPSENYADMIITECEVENTTPSGNNNNNNKVNNKKRFRTKFTEEQKEKMVCFAEKAGWKIQKLDESMVQSFCHEVGIKRRVLKVWMHNNKNTFAKKNLSTN